MGGAAGEVLGLQRKAAVFLQRLAALAGAGAVLQEVGRVQLDARLGGVQLHADAGLFTGDPCADALAGAAGAVDHKAVVVATAHHGGLGKAGVDLPGAVQIPPGKTQLHRTAGIAALGAVEILGLHLLKGTGDEFSVRHGEIERTVQAAEALDALTVTTDHQEQDHDGQQGTVHTVALDQAPGKDGDGDEEQHTVHVILSAPDIFQSVHKRPPFLNSTHLTTPRRRMQGKSPCMVQFPLVFGKKSAIIKTTIFCGAITGTNRRRFLCP